MHTILIVDDNLSDREGIRDLVNWQALDVEVVGIAADGEEGVRSLITELQAELVRVMTMTGIEKPADAHRGIFFEA